MNEDNKLLFPNHWEDYYSYGKQIEGMCGNFIKKEKQKQLSGNILVVNKVDGFISNLKEKKDFNNDIYIQGK